jgi:hypothetical protein
MAHWPSSAGPCGPFCACCPARHAVGLPLNSNVRRWQPAAFAVRHQFGRFCVASRWLVSRFVGFGSARFGTQLCWSKQILHACFCAGLPPPSWSVGRLAFCTTCGVHTAVASAGLRLTLRSRRSTNGMPPGPGRRYVVHFRQPGPGVIPLVPA